jgi:ribosomal protein S18 acetylase RimI-like enzyme
MCDDLIAKHFVNSAPSHIRHPSPEGTTHFTLNPSGQVWLISHTPTDFSTLDDLRPKWTTINSYDPKIEEWAKDWGHTVSQLREMKLEVSYTDDPSNGETSTVDLPENYKPSPTIPTKSWYLTAYPSLTNTVHKAGAQIFSISDHSKSIPKRAGWITVIPDNETRRVYISTLDVLESHRRRGLARWLVGAVAKWWASAGEGKGEVWLTVFESNTAAIKLYEGMGFETTRNMWLVNRAGTKRRLSIKTDEWGSG